MALLLLKSQCSVPPAWTQDAVTIYGKPYGSHQLLKFKTGPVILSVGSGLAAPGYTMLADESIAGDLFALLASKVCAHMCRVT